MIHDSPKPQLVRALGRWTMIALVFNGIIGSGIFLLPSKIAALIGDAAIWGYAIAAVAMAAIVAVLAELSSQYREAGGPYLYARTALGRFAGVQTGWFLWLMRLTAAAAVADGFVAYLAEFWPGATAPTMRATILIGLFGGLAVVNYRGVRAGATLSNMITAAKFATLGLFIIFGLWLVHRGGATPAQPPATLNNWIEALVALVFAYGGFEAALIPAGETKDPRHDMPLALLGGLAVVTVCYIAIHYVTMTAVSDLAHSQRPLADAARAFAGPTGAAAIAIGAIFSTFGWLAAQLLSAPRLTYALAERGDFPPIFARVHPRFLTPHISIVFWAVLAVALAIYGNFIWNAVLSVAARLVTYTVSCAALIRLRRQSPAADAWRAPGGDWLAVFGIVFSVLLISRISASQAGVVAIVAGLAAINWFAVRGRV